MDPEVDKPEKKRSFIRELVRSFIEFCKGITIAKFAIKHQYFLIFLFVLTLLYITNKYGAERDITRQVMLKNRITDLKYEMQTINSSVMEKSRQSKIIEMTKSYGLDLAPSKVPPVEIKR